MAFIQTKFYSYVRKGFVDFTAVLPVENVPDLARLDKPHYPKVKYPTIYLLHGYSGTSTDWVLRSRVEEWAVENGYAVIMPSCNNSFYVDHQDTGILYGTFIGEELIEVTRQMFHLSDKKEDTVIAGLSMGGYGAIRNGLKYSNTFGFIVALSSALITDEVASLKPGQRNEVESYEYYVHTFGPLTKLLGSDMDPKHLASNLVNHSDKPKLYLACGTEDFLYPQNLDYHQFLNQIGYDHVWYTTPGIHHYDFWNASLKNAFETFLPKHS